MFETAVLERRGLVLKDARERENVFYLLCERKREKVCRTLTKLKTERERMREKEKEKERERERVCL